MNKSQNFSEWAEYHITVFGLSAEQNIKMVVSWQPIFERAGFTLAELDEATTWLAGNAPPKFPQEHLLAIQSRIRLVRATIEAEEKKSQQRQQANDYVVASGVEADKWKAGERDAFVKEAAKYGYKITGEVKAKRKK